MLLRKAQRQAVGRVDLQAHRPPPPPVRRVRNLCTSRLSCRDSGTAPRSGAGVPFGEVVSPHPSQNKARSGLSWLFEIYPLAPMSRYAMRRPVLLPGVADAE